VEFSMEDPSVKMFAIVISNKNLKIIP
jgi:hypothetical protein